MWSLPLLLGINLYFAWRYAPLDIDPDFALFNMAGQTGAWYGKDFVDCKSPLVHVWFWLLSRIWKSVYGVRFLHYTLTGLPGIVYTAITGDAWGGLAFVILVHSGFLYAFHGNVGDIPAGLIFLALMVQNPWIASGLFILAVIYEPKLIVALLPWVAFRGFWWQSGAYLLIGLVIIAAIWYYRHEWFEWLKEANLTIPKRMNVARKGLYPWMPHFTAEGFLYTGMWAAVAVVTKPDIIYWMPAILYVLFMFAGRVIRPNHLLPLIGWLAAAGLNPAYVIALSCVDTVSAGFYLGDIWGRFYPGLRDIIKETRNIGEWLKDKHGALWLNTMHSEIHIWSGKPPIYGMTEQIEIAQVAKERRRKMLPRFAKNPPDWVVHQPGHSTRFDPNGYRPVLKGNHFIVYKKDELI